MIAQIVFDLPIDGPFDYLVPEALAAQVTVGSRVKVSFGRKNQIGFVVGLIGQSQIPKLKPVSGLRDDSPVFNDVDLDFARDFSVYYGCSVGEALATILRNKPDQGPSVRREHKSCLSLYRCRPERYAIKIQEIVKGYLTSRADINTISFPPPIKTFGGKLQRESSFLILVPDAFYSQTISPKLDGLPVKIGTRSAVFDSDGRYDSVIMVDEENASYKQEQSPMYETRQVLLRRSEMYGFDVAFVGLSPSVELMDLVHEGQVKFIEDAHSAVAPMRLVDLSNYKFVPGLVSPPVRDALEAALKAGQKGLLVLNRKGSYRLTRCVDCNEVLKCLHCDSPLIYSRAEGKFSCRHCTFHLPGDTVCPKCRKPSWRSLGIGVEQVRSELKKIFPQAGIVAFERGSKNMSFPNASVGNPDILIATRAVLRFQGRWQAQIAAFIDFDAELNRLDMRSAFNAFGLALHVAAMARDVFIQTRNGHHYVLQSLSKGNAAIFYGEELKLRRELGFSPFKHWVNISWRGKSEKSTHQAAQDVYHELAKRTPEHVTVTPPLADARKRDQFRFNVMVQAPEVPGAVALIKSALAQTKRRSRVIVTINIDP